MANLEAGMPVFVRLQQRLGHIVAFAGVDGAGEQIFDVRLDDDGTVVAAGESSLGDPSEAHLSESAPEVMQAAPLAASVTDVPESAPEPAEAVTEPVESVTEAAATGQLASESDAGTVG